MPTLRNNDIGHPAGYTMNSYVSKCSSMLWPPARVNMTMLSAMAGENHCPDETWGKNLLPWNLLPWLHLRRHRRPLLVCIPTPEATWERLMQGGYQGVPLQGNPQFHQGTPPAQAAIHTATGEWRQSLANIPQPDPCIEFTVANWWTYEKFITAKWDSYEGMMALVRDAHWQVLVAVALLEE